MWQVQRGLIQSRGVFAPGIGVTDPYWSNVVLLLGFEGANGSTTITDESSAAHGNASVTTPAAISTAQFKFGASSLSLNGTAGVRYSDSNDWNFAAGNFTVEMFIYPNSVSGTQFLCGQWLATGNLGWILYLNGSSLAWNTSTTGTDNNSDAAGGTVITNSQQHVCVDYNGTKYRIYLNGVMVGSFSTPRTLFNSPNNLSIGTNHSDSSFRFNGYIDELRITKGIARYANDSGYTVPTTAFPRS